ncbi:MAG: sodium:pantothenate symporter, partial [Novibacillus thermophilus]
MTEIQLFLWIGLAAFLVLILGIGIYSGKKTKSVRDFAIGGGQLGPVVLGLSFTGTYLSAAAFLGYPGWSYEYGYSNLWLFLAIMGGGPIGVLMVAKRARKINTTQQSLSLPDWLGDYYSSDFLRIATSIILLFNIFYIAAQFVAGARIFEYLLEIPYGNALMMTTIIVIIYVYVGGAIADVYTDAIQVILMAVTGLLVFVSGIVLFWEGGLSETFSAITAKLTAQDSDLGRVFHP